MRDVTTEQTTYPLACADCRDVYGADAAIVYAHNRTSLNYRGKFEGEQVWSLHFYHASLDGGLNYCACDAEYTEIDASDVALFPELADSLGAIVHISTSEQGFFYCEILTAAEFAKHEAENETCGECDCADPTAMAGLSEECDCECHK